MASGNKVILVGNLGGDPEMRTFPSGDQVANVTIATTDRWRDKTSGENREATEWHRVVFNGRLAEIAGQYLRKGSQVYVEGSIRTRKWTDPQSGQDRYATEIRADTLQMLGGRSQQQGDGGNSGYGSNEGYGNSNYAAPQRQPQADARPPFGDVRALQRRIEIERSFDRPGRQDTKARTGGDGRGGDRHGGQPGQHNRLGARDGRLHDGALERHAGAHLQVDKVHQQDGVAHDDAGQRNHANHAGRRVLRTQ